MGLHPHMCAKDILEKWDKLCEMTEEIRRVVGSSSVIHSVSVKGLRAAASVNPKLRSLTVDVPMIVSNSLRSVPAKMLVPESSVLSSVMITK